MPWLDNSRIVAIFAVVLLHTASGVVTESSIGSENWWIGNIYDSLVRWCVPVFVMISGALLLDSKKDENLSTFYKKRVAKILTPVIFWSAFFMLWGQEMWFLKEDSLSLINITQKILSGKTHYHLWFLYMMIMMYLFTPFFRKAVIYSTRNEVVVLTLLAFLVAIINDVSGKLFPSGREIFINKFLYYIPFFFLGHLIRTDSRNYSKIFLWCMFLFSVFLTATGCYLLASSKGLKVGLYFYSYLSLTVIPMSVSVMYLLKSWIRPLGGGELSKRMSVLTLGVYLIHPVILETFQYVGLGPLSYNPLVSVPIVAILTFCFSFTIALIIEKLPHIKRII